MSSMSSLRTDKMLANWLLALVLLVIGMIVLGGTTRLTNSGLSMTEWNIVTGIIPPTSEAAWLEEFEKYKQIPEFEAEHSDMTVEGFKEIFFWEWAHRIYGRIIGLVYLLGFVYFFFMKRLPKGRVFRFLLIGLLIVAQGLVGKYMVESGFEDGMINVSQYMLAFHLGMAFLVLGLLYWTWKDQREGWSFRSEPATCSRHAGILAFLVFLQIIAGAFVAGIHAGLRYKDWPLMGGEFVPATYGAMSPLWRNIFENDAATQFNHRMLAYTLLAVAILFYWRVRKFRKIKAKATMFMVLLFAQVVLGVWALMTTNMVIGEVPYKYLAHQFLAIFVFISAVGLWRTARLGY